jgi:cysteine synthase A
MIARASELARQPRHYATDQFNNPYIVPAHSDGLGREIWEQTGRVTGFVQGIGTVTSLLGVSEACPRGVHIRGLEPAGSAAISGGAPGAFAMQGWAGSVPPQWDPEKVDDLDTIADDEATEMMLRLAREDGIFGGIRRGRTSSAHTASPRAWGPTPWS